MAKFAFARIGAGTLLAGFCAAAALPAGAQKSLEAFAQPNLRDLTASFKVLTHNDRELEKIGKGYTDAYTLDSQQFFFKEPDRVRFQGKRGLVSVLRISNGNRQMQEVGGLAVLKNRRMENLDKKPGKADTILDLGVLTPGLIGGMESKWVRTEARDGKKLEVFEFWHKADPRLRQTLWIDPGTKIVVDRIEHHRAASKPGFKKRFVYTEPKQFDGVWLPTRVAVYNGENKLAGTARYDSIKVNTGLPDKLFKL
jgi:outer membrane lipoprotein-sorting protein